MLEFQRLTLIGGGLIGGSMALSLKARMPELHVALFDSSQAHGESARALGIADSIHTTLGDAIQGSDVVVIATPVAAIESTLQQLAPLLPERTVVTDVGSTKASVMVAARTSLGERYKNFVPGHPIAGAETSGPGAARADLFVGRRVVLTPDTLTLSTAVEAVSALWQLTGAEVHRLDADEHDTIFAAVSHLPHLLSFALVDLLARQDSAETLFDYAAGGFRDFTRIAASNPAVWRDITLANQPAILKELGRYIEALQTLQRLVEKKDGAAIEGVYRNAQSARLRSQKKLDF